MFLLKLQQIKLKLLIVFIVLKLIILVLIYIIIKYFGMVIIYFLIKCVPVLIAVAFLTLTERKVIGYIQCRKGPNVVGIYGLIQPIADGIKLLNKETLIPSHANLFIYILSPILALTISLSLWSLMPFGIYNSDSNITLGLFCLFALGSINIYALLMSGWSSNSKYALLGALRAAAQMISYEISLGLIIISCILLSGSVNLNVMMLAQNKTIWYIIPLLPGAVLFLISTLAETNRAPFDLTEGESELVSGYNVEYSSMNFALFFLAEYAHIIFNSFLFSILFLGSLSANPLTLLKPMIIVFFFLWVRASYPRLRYDQLMSLLWKTYLPLSLSLIILTNSIIWAFNGLPPV